MEVANDTHINVPLDCVLQQGKMGSKDSQFIPTVEQGEIERLKRMKGRGRERWMPTLPRITE